VRYRKLNFGAKIDNIYETEQDKDTAVTSLLNRHNKQLHGGVTGHVSFHIKTEEYVQSKSYKITGCSDI